MYAYSIYGGPPAKTKSQKWRPPTTMLQIAYIVILWLKITVNPRFRDLWWLSCQLEITSRSISFGLNLRNGENVRVGNPFSIITCARVLHQASSECSIKKQETWVCDTIVPQAYVCVTVITQAFVLLSYYNIHCLLSIVPDGRLGLDDYGALGFSQHCLAATVYFFIQRFIPYRIAVPFLCCSSALDNGYVCLHAWPVIVPSVSRNLD